MRLFCVMVGLLIPMGTGCDSQTEPAGSSSSGYGGAGGAGATGAVGGHGGAGASSHGGTGGSGGTVEPHRFQDVAFNGVAFDLPEWVGTTRALVLFDDGMAFQNYFGVAAPSEIDWSTEGALFYTEGTQPFPGHLASVQTLALRDDGEQLQVGTQWRSPGNGCEVLQWGNSAYQLVKFPALAGSPMLSEENALTDFDCTANGTADGDNCDEVNLCGAMLICSNLTRFAPGYCRPTWMHGVFSESVVSAIPDGNAGGLVRPLSTSGLATVDTDVIVKIVLNHPDWSQLTVTLTNPDNNEVTVWNQETPPPGVTTIHRVPSGFSGDEGVNGTWSLKIVDGASGQSGSLQSWDLEIVSRYD